MGQDTFDAHMQIHFGVEGKGSKELCSKCNDHKVAQTRPPHHCHCNVAEVSEVMKTNCKTAWRAQRALPTDYTYSSRSES